MSEMDSVSTINNKERMLQLTQFSVNVAAEAMFTVSPTGVILSANQTACERLEYSNEELVGKRIADIDPHYPQEMWPTHFDEIRRNGKLTVETQHQSKSGKLFDVEVSIAYFEFEGVEYCCSSIREITSRKQAEHIVQLQHDILARLASTNSGLTETLNELCRMVEELIPQSLPTVMLLDESDGALRFEAGPGLTDEIRALFEPVRLGTSSGSCGASAYLKRPVIVEDTRTSPHWQELKHIIKALNLLACWSIPILDDRDQALGTFAISHLCVRTPTEFEQQIMETASHLASIAIRRKQSDQELQAAHERLAHVSRSSMMGEMASSLAHELNQPLAAMVNHAFVIEKTANSGQTNDVLRRHAAKIREQATRAGDIVSSMRNLAKKTTPSRVACCVNQVIRDVLVLVEPELRVHGIRVHRSLKDAVPDTHIDVTLIQQVLVNLVRNAVESMQQVERSARRLTIETECATDQEILIRLIDTGNGIPEDQVESVFDAFHTTKENGMGMGLAISRSIAEAHGGRLYLQHNRDPGASFCLALPIDRKEPA